MLSVYKTPVDTVELQEWLKASSLNKAPKIFRQTASPKQKTFLAVFLDPNKGRVEGYGATAKQAVNNGLKMLQDDMIEEKIDFKSGFIFERKS